MQITAMAPTYVCKTQVPQSVVDNEKEILLTQIKNDPKSANKPEAIIAKMVEGRVSKFYDTACLLEQQYVKDDDLKVGKYVENTAKALGGEIKVVSFVSYERGEGLEKREDDFAAEIDKLVNGK
jgi:translation elongation factor Ts